VRRTVAEYQLVFSAIPEDGRRNALGREWTSTNAQHWYAGKLNEIVPMPRVVEPNRWSCPLGLALSETRREFDEEFPDTPGAITASQAISVLITGEPEYDPALYEVVMDFMRDWDEGKMTVEEMEAIFA
jgi:hypothetical protein